MRCFLELPKARLALLFQTQLLSLQFELDWFQPAPKEIDAPILLLLYGVGGTKNDHYIKRLTLEASRR